MLRQIHYYSFELLPILLTMSLLIQVNLVQFVLLLFLFEFLFVQVYYRLL